MGHLLHGPPLPWALLALVVGAVWLAAGAVAGLRVARRLPAGPNRQLFAFAGVLRSVLGGGALVGLALAWAAEAPAYAGLALVIGLEELYETSMVRLVARRTGEGL